MLLDEASVRSVHSAIDTGNATCVQVVRHYLDRIDAYDDAGPALHAIIRVNPRALETAAQMDQLDRTTRAGRPLYCIPVVLKDNFHTADMPTSGGSITFPSLRHLETGERARDAVLDVATASRG